MKKYKAAIFDMDGTLLDSMYIWRHLSQEYLKRNDIELPQDIGMTMGLERAVDYLIETFHIEKSPEELRQDLIDVLADFYRKDAVLKPGTIEFLQKLRGRNIPTLLFSATPEHLLHLALERLDIAKYFTHGLLSCHSINHTKHETEAFFIAAEHLGIAPDEVMVFEDALYAARTVKKANMALCVIADEYEVNIDEMHKLADFYVKKNWDEFPVDRFF